MSSNQTSAGPYKHLARLLIRSFYNGPCPPLSYRDVNDVEGARSKLGKVDTTGLGIILMDYLLAKEWVGEAEIVDNISVNHKLIRRALKYLEREQLLMSEHRRETRRSQKRDVIKAVMDAHAEAEKNEEEEDDEVEKMVRPHTISYYAVDFPRLFDMAQLRLHHMKKMLSLCLMDRGSEDELESKEVVAKYQCSKTFCAKEYTSYEVHWLVKGDGELHCDMCDGLVLQVLASGQTGDDLARKDRRNMITSRLKRIESQVKDVLQLVASLRNSNPPFYGTLREWAVSANAMQQRQQLAQEGRGGGGGRQGIAGLLVASGDAANYWQDTQVEVNLGGADGEPSGARGGGAAGASAAEAQDSKPAVLPPWMLRPGAGAGSASATGDSKAGGPSAGADAKGGGAGDLAEEARRAAYVQQYMAALSRAQEDKQQLLQQGGLVSVAAQEASPALEPVAKRARLQPEALEPEEGDGIEGLFEWEEAVAAAEDTTPAAAPDLPAASPAAHEDNADLDWEDI